MESFIKLYKKDGTLFSETLPLPPIVRTSLAAILGRDPVNLEFWLDVFPVYTPPVVWGDPVVWNLTAAYGYARVTVFDGRTIIYQHPHTIEELISRPLQAYLKEKHPEQTHWGFYMIMPGIPPPPLAVRPLDQDYMSDSRTAPEVDGSVLVRPYGENERPAFGLRRIPDDPPPRASLDDFDILQYGLDQRAFVKVLMREAQQEEFAKTRRFSDKVEEGGFLVGRVYEDADMEGAYLLELTNAVNAEHTGASLLHFTYTGDSFSSFKEILRREHPGERMLGWYHTHLFPATDSMGLSSIDLQLHYTTFRQPWQLAGLINIDAPDRRTLRFYVRQKDLMIPCPQWIIK